MHPAVCLCLGVGALLPGAPPQFPRPWGQARPGRALVVDGRSLGGPIPGQQGASLQSSAPPGASCLEAFLDYSIELAVGWRVEATEGWPLAPWLAAVCFVCRETVRCSEPFLSPLKNTSSACKLIRNSTLFVHGHLLAENELSASWPQLCLLETAMSRLRGSGSCTARGTGLSSHEGPKTPEDSGEGRAAAGNTHLGADFPRRPGHRK